MSRGYALILCQEKFRHQTSLPGVIQDLSALEDTFDELNITTRVLKDGTKAQIKQTIDEISTRDFSSEKYLIVSILSHGYENNAISAKDAEYNLVDFIVLPICNNRSLADKPKIFLVDACKGSNEMSTRARCSPKNVFVFYATTEKYVSWEYPNGRGGYFTQNLCKVIQDNGRCMKFREIVNLVIQQVYAESCADGNPQNPTFVDLLSHDFNL